MKYKLQKQEASKPKRRNYVKKVEHEWSHEEIMRLIVAVKERRMLWDMGTPEYKLPKADAWQEVANAIGNVKVDDTKGKWTNLRISFKNNLAKYSSKKLGHGKDEEVVIHWRYFKSLMFLETNDIKQSTESTSSLPMASQNNDSSIFADLTVTPPPPSGIVVGKRKRLRHTNVEPSLPPLPSPTAEAKLVSPSSGIVLGKRKCYKNAEVRPPSPSPSPTADAKSARELAYNALSSFTVNNDRFSIFGQYVASELRALPTDQAIFVQRGLTRELLRLLETFETPVVFADKNGKETNPKSIKNK